MVVGAIAGSAGTAFLPSKNASWLPYLSPWTGIRSTPVPATSCAFAFQPGPEVSTSTPVQPVVSGVSRWTSPAPTGTGFRVLLRVPAEDPAGDGA